MSLLMVNTLRCEVSTHRLRVLQRGVELHMVKREKDRSLTDEITSLVGSYIGRIPWLHSIEFVLDINLVHHLVTPWQEEISTPDELRDYSNVLVRQHFPHLVNKALKMGFEDSAYGHNALTIAVEEEICSALYEAARRMKLRMRKISTPLYSLLHTWHSALPATGIFAVYGDEGSTFACRVGGEWQQVYHMAFPGLAPEQQLALIARLTNIRDAACYWWDSQAGRNVFPALGAEI